MEESIINPDSVANADMHTLEAFAIELELDTGGTTAQLRARVLARVKADELAAAAPAADWRPPQAADAKKPKAATPADAKKPKAATPADATPGAPNAAANATDDEDEADVSPAVLLKAVYMIGKNVERLEAHVQALRLSQIEAQFRAPEAPEVAPAPTRVPPESFGRLSDRRHQKTLVAAQDVGASHRFADGMTPPPGAGIPPRGQASAVVPDPSVISEAGGVTRRLADGWKGARPKPPAGARPRLADHQVDPQTTPEMQVLRHVRQSLGSVKVDPPAQSRLQLAQDAVGNLIRFIGS